MLGHFDNFHRIKTIQGYGMVLDTDEIKLLLRLVYYSPPFENGGTAPNPRTQSDTG